MSLLALPFPYEKPLEREIDWANRTGARHTMATGCLSTALLGDMPHGLSYQVGYNKRSRVSSMG